MQAIGVPVTDATELTGKYDYTIFWSTTATAARARSRPRPTPPMVRAYSMRLSNLG